MRKKTAAIALATGLGLGVIAGPGLASAADSGATPGSGRLGAIKNALAGLVHDKKLTQDQADEVAATLDQKLPRRGPGHVGGAGHVGGPGRFGGPRGGAGLGPAAVAKALGISPEELRAEHEAGKTLTEIAQAHGVSKADLVDKLVAAAQKRLAAEVKAGRLTQARADRISKDLKARITDRVDHVGPARGHENDEYGAPAPSGATSS